MNPEKLSLELVSLERRVKMLLGEYQAVKEELAQLKAENSQLAGLVKQKDELINNFQNQIKISKIVGSIEADEDEASGLKAKINEYIREIDKCIAHLSK
ncbi:hypothetical protein QWY31_05020 [Cytophagales bacterium LB-30]|uniref:Phenylalanyl-tRNA synthetase subunit beta n=1 Tax=Shiella aurantiaca TaxID=3058365 RepID=A0ABT8F318_9BACT|nr:hypothetical protein [Shiella aurantiaca]MDN4164851.1 hypothetical protein [Shiella aurantiaca]